MRAPMQRQGALADVVEQHRELPAVELRGRSFGRKARSAAAPPAVHPLHVP
jgi:hypothetical protein